MKNNTKLNISAGNSIGIVWKYWDKIWYNIMKIGIYRIYHPGYLNIILHLYKLLINYLN